MRATFLLIAALLALVVLAVAENRAPNNGLPLVKAGWRAPSPDDSRLYANCPVTPWARPTHSVEHLT